MAFEFHIWSLDLNLGFKPTSFNLVASCISTKRSILPCHIHASYCALHWLCSSLFVGVCPLSIDVVPTMSSMTPMKNYYYLQKCQASKTTLFIPIQSHSLAPALFYCIRTNNDSSAILCCGSWTHSSAWPVIATVNRWNPLAWVGVVWALMCLLIHACLSCLLLPRVESGMIHRGWIRMVMNMSYYVWAKCVNTIW